MQLIFFYVGGKSGLGFVLRRAGNYVLYIDAIDSSLKLGMKRDGFNEPITDSKSEIWLKTDIYWEKLF